MAAMSRRRKRARGSIETLPSGALRVAVYAGTDPLSGRRHKDTSRQGRWHNAKFKALAEELGIEVTKDERLGWSPTMLPAATRETYEAVIGELGRVLRLYRSVEVSGGSGTKSKPAPPLECGCGRKIRVGKAVLALGPILCGLCGTAFAAGDDADEELKDGETGS